MQLRVVQLSAVWDHMQPWVELAEGLSLVETLPHLTIVISWHSQGGFHVITFSCLQFIVLEHVLKWRDELGAPQQRLDFSINAKERMGSQLRWDSCNC